MRAAQVCFAADGSRRSASDTSKFLRSPAARCAGLKAIRPTEDTESPNVSQAAQTLSQGLRVLCREAMAIVSDRRLPLRRLAG